MMLLTIDVAVRRAEENQSAAPGSRPLSVIVVLRAHAVDRAPLARRDDRDCGLLPTSSRQSLRRKASSASDIAARGFRPRQYGEPLPRCSQTAARRQGPATAPSVRKPQELPQ